MPARSQDRLYEREWANYTDPSGHQEIPVPPVSTGGGGHQSLVQPVKQPAQQGSGGHSAAVVAPGGSGTGTPAPPVEGPTADWVKADIVEWLLAHGCTETRTTLNGMLKADLLALVP